MRKFATLVLLFVLTAFVSAQLPGPPVGAPQTNQNSSYGYNFQYTFIPTSTTGGAFRILPTITTTTSTGNTVDGLLVAGTYAIPNSSSSATQLAGIRAGTITCTANSGTITACSNFVVDAAPSGGSTNISAWLKGDTRLGATLASTMSATGGSSCGNALAANGACGNTTGFPFHVMVGTYVLSGSTSTITGISPAFTSTTSYNCVANDITTRANPVQAVPASGSSVTITNTTGATDTISMICAGT
jgi:hypothetical protein